MTGPLLVTGLPRTGTSWTGKMLEASGEVVYVNEPMNPGHPPGGSPGVLNASVTHQFQYIAPGNDEAWRRAFTDTLALRYRLGAELRRNRGAYDLARAGKYLTAFTAGRLRGRRALVDDPFALLSTRWLVQEMGCQAVVLVRDPVSVVGSWRSLGWGVQFHELLEQPDLVRDHLGPYVERMRSLIGSPDWLARSCLLWELAYDLVQREIAPLSRVQIVRYEALVQEPMGGFRELYADLGLSWSARARQRVEQATTGVASSASAHAWSLTGGLSRTAYRPMAAEAALRGYQTRLTPSEIERIRELTAEATAHFYPPAGGELPRAKTPAGTPGQRGVGQQP